MPTHILHFFKYFNQS